MSRTKVCSNGSVARLVAQRYVAKYPYEQEFLDSIAGSRVPATFTTYRKFAGGDKYTSDLVTATQAFSEPNTSIMGTMQSVPQNNPALDEVLEVGPDGAFRLIRRVSADRAGTFAGALDATQRGQLTAALDVLGEPFDIDPSMPRTVLELIDRAGGSASFPLEEELPPEWERVREVLQTLVEELKAFPAGALELRLDESAETATFELVGSEPVNANLEGAQLSLSLFAEDEEYVDSATVAVPSDFAEMSPLPPGWRRDIALEHGLPFNPKRTLQVTVDFSIDGDEGQLLCTAGKGWF